MGNLSLWFFSFSWPCSFFKMVTRIEASKVYVQGKSRHFEPWKEKQRWSLQEQTPCSAYRMERRLWMKIIYMGFHPRVVYLVNLSHVLGDCRHCRSIRMAVCVEFWYFFPNQDPRSRIHVAHDLYPTHPNHRKERVHEHTYVYFHILFYSVMSLRLCYRLNLTQPPFISSPQHMHTRPSSTLARPRHFPISSLFFFTFHPIQSTPLSAITLH